MEWKTVNVSNKIAGVKEALIAQLLTLTKPLMAGQQSSPSFLHDLSTRPSITSILKKQQEVT